jgi:hypothetical protein
MRVMERRGEERRGEERDIIIPVSGTDDENTRALI